MTLNREKSHEIPISTISPGIEVDVLIIGAGIAGISVSLSASAAGLSTLLVSNSDSPPASAAALGLIYLSSFKGVQYRRAVHSVMFYAERGWLVSESVWMSDWRTKTAHPSVRHKVVDVSGVLSSVRPMSGQAVRLTGRTVQLADGRTLYGRRGVVICTGADSLLDTPTPDKITWGATLSYPSMGRAAAIHRLRPYHDAGLVDNGRVRLIGSSSADNPYDVIGAVNSLAAVSPFSADGQGEALVGRRAFWGNPQQKLEPVWRGDVCYFGGLGKSGFALAPAMAAEIVRKITHVR